MQIFRFCLLKERTVIMNIQQNRITALYCRLSRDDDFGGDSGTNFDRPDFCRMINDIERGKVGAVVVKDLSRLGREYLKTGYYTEIFFPEHDVRFIAVNDNVDSNLVKTSLRRLRT